MTQFWPELRGLFQTIALLHLAPKPGPGEAESGPCSSAGWAGGWRGGEGRALFVPRFPRASADAAPLGCWIRPWGPSHKSRPRRAAAEAPWGRDRDNLGTPLWGTGAGRRRRLPGIRSRGTLGVALGCLGLGALCALAAGPRPLAGPAAPASLPAPPPAAPLKRPRSSASVPPWTPRSRMMLQLVLLAALALCGEVPPGAFGLRTS